MKIFGMNWGNTKHDIKAIIVYPNKQIAMKRVKVTEDRFQHEGRQFLIDEKSVYFMDKQPVSFYHFKDSSPKIINITNVEDSMKSKEVSAVMESKIVQDILSGASGTTDWVLWAAVAAAGLSLIILLNDMGFINLARGG